MPNSSKIQTIIAHEYTIRVKSKGFIIGTIIAPFILVAIIAIPIITTLLSFEESDKRLAIVDKSGLVASKIIDREPDKYFLAEKSEEELKESTLGGEIDGYLIIPGEIIETGEARVYTRGGGGIGYISRLEERLGYIIRHERLKRSGVDTGTINKIEEGISISTNKVTVSGTEKDFTQELSFIGYFLGFVIYALMFIYGTMVSRSVIEEKANRIIEVIASSAKPFEIMLGKVVGVGLVGLTQVLFWIILSSILLFGAGFIINTFINIDPQLVQQGVQQAQGTQDFSGFEIPTISPWLALGFVFYFLSGYFIYSTLFAAIGSAVDQEQDAAQLQIPVTLPIIIPILLIGNIMTSPDSTFAVVTSLIPFFTPILMMVRVAATDVPLWQIAASVILLVGTFLGCLWVAARIYKIGILMTGKKPTFKDLAKWIKLAK